ncbi:Spore cortex-lytic enzyme [Paenibacillus sp. CECT 9249]|nr:spore cortex-lytic enzyme [Paenibacillus sp. MSJ-34]CAH0119873.1 Spore cortex-lytic enzyme [Paenibacillus sp. CECT 9249]
MRKTVINKRLIWITLSIVLVLFGTYHLKTSMSSKQTFGDAVLTVGFSGKDVYELQGRLKFLGFYHGKVDGYFGEKTLGSVKWFQSEFGLKVDGFVGGKTKLKLWEATKHWRPTAEETGQAPAEEAAPSPGAGVEPDTSEEWTSNNNRGYSENDLKLMANAVYGESRGEPFEGQVAVAAVILNRVKSPSFPNSVSGVIFQPGAFTAVDDGQIWLTPNENARKAVEQAINGWDPTGGCLYYFNPVTATSKWIWSRPQVKTIGKHIFCM